MLKTPCRCKSRRVIGNCGYFNSFTLNLSGGDASKSYKAQKAGRNEMETEYLKNALGLLVAGVLIMGVASPAFAETAKAKEVAVKTDKAAGHKHHHRAPNVKHPKHHFKHVAPAAPAAK